MIPILAIALVPPEYVLTSGSVLLLALSLTPAEFVQQLAASASPRSNGSNNGVAITLHFPPTLPTLNENKDEQDSSSSTSDSGGTNDSAGTGDGSVRVPTRMEARLSRRATRYVLPCREPFSSRYPPDC